MKIIENKYTNSIFKYNYISAYINDIVNGNKIFSDINLLKKQFKLCTLYKNHYYVSQETC